MKTTIACVGFLLVGSWLLLSVWLLGYFELNWLPLKRPATSAEFGDSIGAINGLFSSLAVLLALVAVLIQGRELKASTQAQNDQAQALREQLDHQRSLQQEQTRRSEAMLEQLKH